MPTLRSFAVLLVPTGAAALVFSVANNSFVQLGVDPQMRGRVMALYFMCFMGGTPVGAPLIGWISEHLGAPWGLILGGGVCVVAGLVAAAVLARGRRVRLEAGWPRRGCSCGSARGGRRSTPPGCGPPRNRRRPGAWAAVAERLSPCGSGPAGVPFESSPRSGRRRRGRSICCRSAAPSPCSPPSSRWTGPTARWVHRRWTRRRAAAPSRPGRRPLQVVAADVRRLGRQIALVPAGAPMARRRAWPPPTTTCWSRPPCCWTCRNELRDGAAGPARDLARLRLLAVLEEAGLAVDA